MGVPVQDNTGNKFFEAVQRATDSAYTVLVFHGVPDLPHPWVNTEPGPLRSVHGISCGTELPCHPDEGNFHGRTMKAAQTCRIAV